MGSRDPALVIEAREFRARRVGRDRRYRVGMQLRNLCGIRLFTVEDRGDIADCARRRHEIAWQRFCLLGYRPAWILFFGHRHRHVGASVGGIERGDHALAHFRCRLGAAGFPALAASAPHAGLDERPADRRAAILDRFFRGQSEDALTAGPNEAESQSENPALAPNSHRASPFGSGPMPYEEYLIPAARG